MLINCIELEKLGYTRTKAHDLSNQLCIALRYTNKQCYIDVVRNGKKFNMYQNIRSIERSAVIDLCNSKIEKSKTNKRINVSQWEELKEKLENSLKTIDIGK